MIRRFAAQRETQDWFAVVLLLAGLLAVVTGVLPAADARTTMDRAGPLLAFLATVIVLAELVSQAEVFDVAASWLARRARGRPGVLFGLCVTLAATTTIVLNLDTTAVLLTPVLLALAVQIDLPALPFAMTAVWLANTASLVLPSSNLTNVLASERVSIRPVPFAGQMLLPALVAILITAALLWVCFWRGAVRTLDEPRYEVPPLHRPADPKLALIAVLACLVFIVMVLAGLPLAVASGSGMVLMVAACAVRRRSVLTFTLIPFQLLILVPGIFLVVQAVSVHGLAGLVASLAGTTGGAHPGTALTLRMAGLGGGLSNLINNLPAYLAGEGALGQPPDREALLGLLIGVNAGPVVLPWASLATLLWLERCRAAKVAVPMGRFVLTGLLLAVLTVAGAAAALVLA